MVKTWALCLPWAKLPREDWHSWLGEDPILSFGRAWVWGEKDIVWLMGQPPFWCVTLDELLHFLSSRFLLCNMGIIKCYIPRLGREKWVLSKCQLRKQVCGGCVSWPNLRAGKWHKPNWSQDWLTLTFMIDLPILLQARDWASLFPRLHGWAEADKTQALSEPTLRWMSERMDTLEGSAGTEFCWS